MFMIDMKVRCHYRPKKSADVKKKPSIGTPGANQVEYKHIRISTDLPCVRATATVVSVCCLKVPYIHGN